MKTEIKLVLIVSCLLGVLPACTPKLDNMAQCPFANNPTDWSQMRSDPHRFIAHAAGEIEGHRYTNSLQALEKSINRGYRMIEFDLQTLKTDDVVATHDWSFFREVTGYKGPDDITLADFKKQKVFAKYIPATLKEVSAVFEKNPDIYLVTDKIKEFDLLKKNFYSMDRLLVEIFSIDDYYKAVKAGIKYPMLSIESSGDEKALEFAIKNKIPLLVLHSESVAKFRPQLSEFVKNKGCVFAFSSNEQSFIKDSIEKQLITGVYADAWDLKNGKCDAVYECNTY